MLLEELLKPIIAEKKQLGIPRAVILNYLKEHIQYLVLNLIYNHPKFKRLVFKGGSCLRICYRLPRLSEDLDFDYGKKQFSGRLLPDLEKYLSEANIFLLWKQKSRPKFACI
jgi:predicted nucleotidyltransferase component of viral defense system